MFGLDLWIAGLANGGPVALLVALVLGLRHATDPDHFTAVSSLVLADGAGGRRQAGLLGFAWGCGHAVTLLLCGLPVVLLGQHLPAGLHRLAETAVGVVIVVLAVRLLLQWWRLRIHSHWHAHGGTWHAHPHAHAHPRESCHTVRDAPRRAEHAAEHEHRHAEALGRTPLASFGIGLLHGVGGSGAAGILLAGAHADRGDAAIALLLFAAGTALSMGLLSLGFGHALLVGPLRRRTVALLPAFGSASLLFGVWYVLVGT